MVTRATRGSGGRTLLPALDDKNPEINKRESPGKKNPTSKPDSAKIIAPSNTSPPLSNQF
jgi:hypothetical protein